MVYPFEDAAYKTKIGEVSKPFKTRFGYHIVKVDDIRPSKGEVAVAHILITDKTPKGKLKIDSIYLQLKKGVAFEKLAKEYSNDSGSKLNGGKLNKFGVGRMVTPFENAAFSLEKEGEISKPFQTRFGWHIVKLIKKYPVGSFDEMKPVLERRIASSGRGRLSDEAVLNKLKKRYQIKVNPVAKTLIEKNNYRSLSKDSLQITLVSINDKKLSIKDFADYTHNRRHKPTSILLEMFIDKEILQYYKDHLLETEPEFAATLQEYQDGLLLFELMKRKIWDKSSKDTLGLKQYFEKHKAAYKTTDLEKVKGEVINDYQTYLDRQWIADLRKKSKIKIKKKQLKKLIKYYKKKNTK